MAALREPLRRGRSSNILQISEESLPLVKKKSNVVQIKTPPQASLLLWPKSLICNKIWSPEDQFLNSLTRIHTPLCDTI